MVLKYPYTGYNGRIHFELAPSIKAARIDYNEYDHTNRYSLLIPCEFFVFLKKQSGKNISNSKELLDYLEGVLSITEIQNADYYGTAYNEASHVYFKRKIDAVEAVRKLYEVINTVSPLPIF